MNVVEVLERALAGQPHRGIVVAFSGGPDSTALLHATARLGPARAVHVNHGLHPAARGWQAHCERVAAALDIPLVCVSVAVAPGNREAQARAARYEAFVNVLRDGEVLLLGHHARDQSETVLLRLIGGRGWLPMPAGRRLGAGRLLRPWLEVPPAAIEAYARGEALAERFGWIEDPANDDIGHDRNYMRHQVLRSIETRFPGVHTAIARTTRDHAARDRLLGESLGGGTFEFREVAGFGDDVCVVALRIWLAGRGQFGISDRRLAEFVRQVRAGTGHPRLDLDHAALRVHAGTAEIVTPWPALADRYPGVVPDPVDLPHGRLGFAAGAARGIPAGPFEIRFRVGGEHLRRRGMRTPLKRLFQEAGVAPWRRGVYPLVYRGGELCAVPSIATADDVPNGSADAGTAGLWVPVWIFH